MDTNNNIIITKNVRKALILFMLSTIFLSFMHELASAQVTVFNDSTSSISISFPQEFLTERFFVRVPNGTVSEARMNIRGFDMLGQKGLPRDVILVTDTSGSMDDNCGADGRAQTGETPCKINNVKSADIHFLNNVDMNYIHVGLVHYQSSAYLDNILSTDRTILINRINTYAATGSTNIGNALQRAMSELSSVRAQRPGTQKYILLMTDGWANCLQSGACYDDEEHNALAEDWAINLAYQAAANNIIIYAISFGECGETYIPRTQINAHCTFMDELAAITGGISYNAPQYDPAALLDIYDEIAEQISTQDFPTPTINSTAPVRQLGWRYPTTYSGNALWNGASCGIGSATCSDFRTLVQDNLAQCAAYPCDIRFSVYSTTVGILTLSDLFIEINEPPAGNYPPIGSCRSETMTCGQTQRVVDIDDGTMVTDPNDALNTLTWIYNPYLSFESQGGSYFSLNPNFNTTRELVFTVDASYIDRTFWRTFFFNVSDPWNAINQSCINVSYEGCAVSICGNEIVEPGETCDDGCMQGLPNICEPADNGDGCSRTCQTEVVPPGCGNAVLENGETCDDGCMRGVPFVCEPEDNGDGCSRTCQTEGVPRCGNAVLENGETCDDGCGEGIPGICEPADNGDGCSSTCQLEVAPGCGNGERESGETCDDGCMQGLPNICEPVDNGDGCSATCTLEIPAFCGNGIEDSGEQCDDGCMQGIPHVCEPVDNEDGCNATCEREITPVITLVNMTVSFDYSAFPGYNYSLRRMLSPYADLPAAVDDIQFQITPAIMNFSIIDPDSMANITIAPNNWFSPTSEIVRVTATYPGYTDTAYLTIIYTGGAPPTIDLIDSTISFDYSAYPRHNYSLRNMLNPYAILPGDISDLQFQIEPVTLINFTLNGPNSLANITVAPKNWLNPTSEIVRVTASFGSYSDTAYLNITYTGGATPTVDLTDTTISFGYSAYPGYNYSLRNMLNPSALLPGNVADLQFQIEPVTLINFTLNGPDSLANITVWPNNWFHPTSEVVGVTATYPGYSDTAYLTIIYTAAGAPEGSITCRSDLLRYMLHTDEPYTIDLDEIFRFTGDPGTVNNVIVTGSTSNLVITPAPAGTPDRIDVTATDSLFRPISIRVRTNLMNSDECDIHFLNLNMKCDKPACASCDSYLCLLGAGCLERSIWVLDPFTSFRPSSDLPFTGLNYEVTDFETWDGFGVDPTSGDESTTFLISDTTGTIPHGTQSAAIIRMSFAEMGYANAQSRMCIGLTRYHQDIGEITYDPDTSLLITGSRAVMGFYEMGGYVFSKGPYIFIAKVWLRE